MRKKAFSSTLSLTLLTVALCQTLGLSRAGATTCDPTIQDDDSAIRITSGALVDSTRSRLLTNIFGSSTIPSPAVPAANIHLNVSPSSVPVAIRSELTNLLAQLTNVGRVDMIEYPMKDAGGNVLFTSLGWHIVPQSGAKNKLVIVHQGHDRTLVDDSVGVDGHLGLARTMKALLFEGYSVIGMYMPGVRPDQPSVNHATLMSTAPQGGGSGTRFFMEPIRAFLDFAKTVTPAYTNFYMTGLSGGGWSTTVYSAIDPTIELSFPVAGSVPLYMRCPNPTSPPGSTYNHDAEQFKANGIYAIAGYQDLYILGSVGTSPTGFPRHQTQILNRKDDCCFGQAEHFVPGPWDSDVNSYEVAVRNQLYQIGRSGTFRVEIDENTTSATPSTHMVSTGAIFKTILGELNDARRVIGRPNGVTGGNDSDAFYRGLNGHLWHRSIAGGFEEDTNIPIVGVPDAAFAPDTNPTTFDVIARDVHGSPVFARTRQSSGGWFFNTFSGTMNTDPTLVSGKGSGEIWAFAQGTDYLPYVWDLQGHIVQISSTPALGPLSASLRAFEQGFHVFYLGWDRSVRHAYRSSPTAAWTTESLGGVTFGYPAGTVDAAGNLTVFQLGTDGKLYWNRKTSGDQNPGAPWTGFQSVTALAGADSTVLTGTPSISGSGSTWKVFVPTVSKGMALFTSTSATAWTFTDLGGSWVSAPTATSAGGFFQGKTGGLWRWLSGTLSSFGGLFD